MSEAAIKEAVDKAVAQLDRWNARGDGEHWRRPDSILVYAIEGLELHLTGAQVKLLRGIVRGLVIKAFQLGHGVGEEVARNSVERATACAISEKATTEAKAHIQWVLDNWSDLSVDAQ